MPTDSGRFLIRANTPHVGSTKQLQAQRDPNELYL